MRRLKCWFICGLMLLGAHLAQSQDKHTVNISPKALEVLNMPPLEIQEKEDPLVRLKKLRFNAALNEAKERYALYKRGLTQLSELMEVGQRVLRAQVDLAQSPAERIAILQRQISIYEEAESNLERQVKAGIGQQADLERLRYNLYTAQIELQNMTNP